MGSNPTKVPETDKRLTATLERIEASNANLKVWVMATAIASVGLLFAAFSANSTHHTP